MIPSTGFFPLSLSFSLFPSNERTNRPRWPSGWVQARYESRECTSIGSNRRRRNFVRLIEPNVRCVSRNDRLPFPPPRILFLFFVPLYRGSLAWVSFYGYKRRSFRFTSWLFFLFFFFITILFQGRKFLLRRVSFFSTNNRFDSRSITRNPIPPFLNLKTNFLQV